MPAADLVGGAARRRQRQLRAFRRHVQMAVKLELATALHHSAQRVEGPREGEVHEKHDGLRAQKRPLLGTRPAPLAEVAGPQVRAGMVGYMPASVPRLAGHCLSPRRRRHRRHCPLVPRSQGAGGEGEEAGGREGEGGAHLGFLGAQEDEEKEVEASTSWWCADTTLWARVPLSPFVVWCAVFPSFVDRPEMLGIMAGMYKKDSTHRALVLNHGSGLCMVGFSGDSARRAVFLPFNRPKMLRIMAGTHQKDSCPRRTGNWTIWEMTWYFPTAPVFGSHMFGAVA